MINSTFLIHRIMASLNLLRYLVIKDCESDNQVSTNWFENDWLAEGRAGFMWALLSLIMVFAFFFFAMVNNPEVMLLLTTLGDMWRVILFWWDLIAFMLNCYCKKANPFTLPDELWSIILQYITIKSHLYQIFPWEKIFVTFAYLFAGTP